MSWLTRRKPQGPAPLGVGPSGGKLGGKTERVNPWPRCASKACTYARVPQSAIHKRCNRASMDLGPIPHTHNHGTPCCPGWCRVCEICWDRNHVSCNQCGRCILECPGACSECGECLDLCPGHTKGEED